MEDSYRRANCLMILLNIWQCKFMCKSAKTQSVQESELLNMSEKEDAVRLALNLEEAWAQQQRKPNPSFSRAFSSVFCCRFVSIACIGVVSESMPALYLYVTKLFIDFIGDPNADFNYGLTIFLIFSGLLILSLILRHLFYFHNAIFGVVMRKALTAFLYQKLLRLSQSSVARASAGKLVNMASGDMAVIERGSQFVSYIIVSPICSLINLTLIYLIIGSSVLYAMIVIVFVYFLQFPINKYLVKIRLSIAGASDTRLNVINKLILGMRTIKTYAWEDPIIKNAQDARRVECRRIFKQYFVKGLSDGIFRNSVILLWMPVILIKVAFGEQLEASSLFTAMNMLASLGFITIFFLNLGMNSAAEYTTVLKRIEDVLVLEEIKPELPSSKSRQARLVMERVRATWGFLKSSKPAAEKKETKGNKQEKTGLREPLLPLEERQEEESEEFRPVNKEINLHLDDGQLVGVIGRIGSGKSSLLATILGETIVTSGHVKTRGSLAYVEQEPCILSDTVRNNITFGKPLDEDKLAEVIKVCELKEDLKLFVRGLDTEIGERGVNISGGQKARISLARACYSDADLYLLDDPLSAVDPAVAQKLFTNCIKGYLKSKARILVTHQLSFLHRVEKVLMLEDGEQKFLGSYAELKQFECERGTDLCAVLSNLDTDRDRLQSVDLEDVTIEESPKKEEEKEEGDGDKKKAQDLIVAEEKIAGTLGFSVYRRYLSLSCSWIINILVILLTLAPAIIQGYLRLFITNWVSLSFEQQQDSYYSWGYLSISIGAIAIAMISSISLISLLLYISNQLHNKMLKSVTRAPILFFDSNPLGRIINRFSKDTAVIDGALPMQVIIFVGILWGCIMLMALSVSVFPYLGIVVVVLIGFMLYIRKISLGATMDSLRLDAMTRSPINSMFSASLNGLLTIRAYRQEKHFTNRFMGLVDHNGKAFFTYTAAARWMAYNLDYVSAMFILCTVGFAFALKSSGTDPAYVAMGITSAMGLSGPFQFFIRSSADVANSMTSVQRMQEYADLKGEPPSKMSGDYSLKERGWPQKGELAFDRVTMRYREGFDPVLKGVNFALKAGMKVGVVGRTGAGKSSLLQALFRLSECDVGGGVSIDGVQTRTVGLRTLREAISIIPQSPFLFEGTVRENLDPFGQYSDGALWSALEDVQLRRDVVSVGGLEQKISEGSSVFSVGQKQLLCLARAILRNNKILVLDEATANVDIDTDAQIQTTIREKFAHCTVLTIAHRLDTVIDSHRILVLSKGEVLEFAHPHKLLENEAGHFSGMVEATGSASAVALRQKAEEAFNAHKEEGTQ